MKAIIQRVVGATVKVDGTEISSISNGMLVLFCVETEDTEDDIQKFVKKTVNLRIFDDKNGIMNLDIRETEGEILVVSQFTLAANVKKGNRPSYILAARPEKAVPYYEKYCTLVSEAIGKEVKKGKFGADMKVSLVNDGPVTIILDSDDL